MSSVQVYKGLSGTKELGDLGFKTLSSTLSEGKLDDDLIFSYRYEDLAFLITKWDSLPFYNFNVIESLVSKPSFLSHKESLVSIYKKVFDDMETQRLYRWYMSREDSLLSPRLSKFWNSIASFSRYDTYTEDVSTLEKGYEFRGHNMLTSRRHTSRKDFTLISGSLKQEYRNFPRNTFI